MSSIATALQGLSTHRDVVPVYFHRPSGKWIITALSKNNGGAVIMDEAGEIIQFCSSKHDALVAVGSN